MKTENQPILPKGWTWSRLDDIVEETKIGVVRSSSQQNNEGNGVGYIKMNNITMDGRVVFDDLVYVSASRDEVNRYGLHKGDILFNTRNSVELVGKTGLVRTEVSDVIYNNNIMRLRASKHISSSYLAFQMCSPIFRERMDKVKRSTTNVAAIYGKDLLPLPIVLAPFNEQHRIVAKIEELFTELDAGVEALKKVKAQLKRYRQAVLKHAFECKLTEAWREAHRGELEPASVLLGRIREERAKNVNVGAHSRAPRARAPRPYDMDTSSLPQLPESWMWTRVMQLSTKVTDGVHKTPRYVESGIPFISVNNMSEKGTLSFSPCKYITPEEHAELCRRCDPEYGDLLLSKVGTIGLTAVVRTEREFSLFVNTALIKPIRKSISPEFLSLSLRYGFSSSLYNSYILGSTQKFIGTTSIELLPVPLAPAKEQEVIVEEIERRFSIADEVEKVVEQSLKQAERLRQSILKRAFEGNLVPQDPNDEPADKLLERIKHAQINHVGAHSRAPQRTVQHGK